VTHYFTGKPCKRGHTANRYKTTGNCVECLRLACRARGDKDKPAKRAWRARNKEKISQWNARRDPESQRADAREWRAANLERAILRCQRWREGNRERIKAYTLAYDALNYERKLANNSNRRAAALRACPPWADRKEIGIVYKMAAAISATTATPHHVDHIVPLRGKNVCGLHVPWNLRPIPAIENRKKHARVPTVEEMEELYGQSG
jgi:hypothetical protein